MKTVAILEGWAGGPKLTRLLRSQLTESGFRVIKDTGKANIIIAHSTGCYMLPKSMSAQLIVLINPPYWPGQSILGRWIRMNKDELKFLRKQQGTPRFLKDKLWETYYIFVKPLYTWSVLNNKSHLDFLKNLDNRAVVLVRNRNDEFCSPKIKDVLVKYKTVSYAEVPGYHADYYINSKPYIDLLLKELK